MTKNKKLTVIIPRYDETESQMLPLMASIVSQVGIDPTAIEIIISNDKPGDVLSMDLFGGLGLDIRRIDSVYNGGPGIARQRGLDEARGEWVIFCDADDVLHNVASLSTFSQESARHPETDIILTQWYEEVKGEDGAMRYLLHDFDHTWLHGKAFKKDFLSANEIRFREGLRSHEDSYFLAIAMDKAKNRRNIPQPTYVWKWRDKSITRANGAQYTFKDFPVYIHAMAMAAEKLKEDGSQNVPYLVAHLVTYCYFSLQRPEWTGENLIYNGISAKALGQEMEPFWEDFDKIDQESMNRIYNKERDSNFEGMVESYSLVDFIKGIRRQEREG